MTIEHTAENGTTHKKTDIFSDIIIGLSDGLIVPFALVAGLTGIALSSWVIGIAGIATTLAGAIAMSVGGYRAAKGETVHHHHNPESEQEEILKEKKFLANIGLSEDMQEKAIEEMEKDKKLWVDFITKYENEKPDAARAGNSALNIGLSYAAGGLVPVLPYLFTSAPLQALMLSAIITLLCLFIFGYIKSKLTGKSALAGGLRAILAGAIAAGAAYGVARLFQ